MSDTTLQNRPSSIASWVLLIAQALEANGVDSEQLFCDAELDLSKARDPNSRFPVHKMARVWQLATERTQDPCFALQLAPLFQPSTFNALGMAFMSSRTLLEALERMIRFYQLTTDAAVLTLHHGESSYDVEIRIPEENHPVADESIEAWITSVIKMLRNILGEDFCPLKVEFGHTKSIDITPYEDYFKTEVRFGCDISRISFSEDLVLQEISFANPALAANLDEWMGNYLKQFKQDLLSTRVKEYILRQLALGEIKQTEAAKSIGISTRSMQRQLKEEDTNFTDLLDECRRQQALKFIVQPKIPLIEIVFMLGFSDQSNFARAFRRWTNMSPAQYREAHC